MAINVGWCTANTHCSELLYDAPEPVRINVPCPVIGMWTTQTFLLRAPYDFDLHIQLSPQGPGLGWGEKAPSAAIQDCFALTRPDTWRDPNKPQIMWRTDHLFLADEEVVMESCAPFYHYDQDNEGRRWPGVMIPSRWDIEKWVRPLAWTLEWQDLDRPISIRRGDPLSYVRFFTRKFDDTFRMKRLPYTEEMAKAVERGRRVNFIKKKIPGFAQRLLGYRPKKWLP
jgi:hypothetical protein